MKCPVCSAEIMRDAAESVTVKVLEQGRLLTRLAHRQCIELLQKSRTTVQRP